MMREGGDSSEDRDTAVCIFVYLQRDDRIQHHYRHRVKAQGPQNGAGQRPISAAHSAADRTHQHRTAG